MNSQMAADLMREEELKKPVIKEDKTLVKKIQSFHQGRVSALFPGNVKFDVNDHEFVETLLDLDHVYDTSHKLNVVLIKYTRSIESKLLIDLHNVEMSKVNGLLGPQAVKIYPPGHINHGNAQNVQQTHLETAQYYKEFMVNHKQTCDQFKVYFQKFDEIYALLK